MQNSRGSAISPFNAADGLLTTSTNPGNPTANPGDFLPSGVLWPYSQLFSPPYFPQPPPPPSSSANTPTAGAYPIPTIYCQAKPHVVDSSMLMRPEASSVTATSTNNNNMTIQIGLQCHNEAPPPPQGLHSTAGPRKNKNGNKPASARHLPDDDLAIEDEDNQDEINRKLFEFTKLAIHGCDLAEKVTKNHKYRPCFKKIDSLCARLKQDISRPDGVLNNLNSQGMAWAVKDFIFVFTRIINAWLILKGYIYNRSEGMRKVQSSFSGNFQEGFFQWQRVTQQLIENIIESFENLDEAVQKSRTNNGGPTGGNGCATGGGGANGGPGNGKNSRMSAIDLNNFLWENKEVTMRNGGKGGGGGGHAMNGNAEEKEVRGHNNAQQQGQRGGGGGNGNANLTTPVYNEAERDEFETYYKTGLYQSMKRAGGGGGSSGGAPSMEDFMIGGDKENVCPQPASAPQPQQQQKTSVDEMDLIDKLDFENNIKRYEQETEANIQYLLYRVGEIKESSFFFNSRFLKNYFPDFDKVIRDFKDIKTIIMDAEQGKYKYVFALVADLRMIVQSCRLYWQLNPNAQMGHVVVNFEKELEAILAEKCFAKYF